VANPPRTTSGVTHAGNPATGVREPTVTAPDAIPRNTCTQRWIRCSARARVGWSSWVEAVMKAAANCPCG
jgi:hypothetical protein